MACWKEKLNLPEDQHFTGLRWTDVDANPSRKNFFEIEIYSIYL